MTPPIRVAACVAALCLTAPLWAVDAATAQTQNKAKLEFVRSNSFMAVVKARIEVNGRRIGEVGKGETSQATVDPGRTLIKIDSAFAPGQVVLSFNADNGGEYQFQIVDGIDKTTTESLFGNPVRVPNGEVLESSGLLRVSLGQVKLPAPTPVAAAPTRPEPAPEPAKTQPVAPPSRLEAAPLPAILPVTVPAPTPLPVSTATPPAVAVVPPKPASEAPNSPKPATTTSVAPLPPTPAGAQSMEEQLRTLKRLFELGLISNEAYQDKQRKILEQLK